jgi:iron complex outermembrane receptor protein
MICSIHIVQAQHKIYGRITDTDQKPLEGAFIFLPDNNKGTLSKNDGSYELNNLPAGKIKIQFSYVGYANKIESVNLTGETLELNVILEKTVTETEAIVISGGSSSTQHENSVKIDVLPFDYKEIRSTPNVSEILIQLPGISMISKGSGVSKPVIRGLSMNDILVLNNGVRFENYQYSSHHPLGIDEFGIDDIEVIKGPASLLYGSDAIGGVVNFIKEKPAPVNTICGDYNLQLFSNTLGITNNAGVKGSSKNFFGSIRVGQKSNADFLQGGGHYAPNTRFNEYTVKTSSGYTGKTGSFKLFYDFSDQKMGLAEEEAINLIKERGRAMAVFYQEYKTHLLTSQNKLYWGKIKIDLMAAYQNTELTHFAEANVYELQMRLATLNYEAKVSLPSDKNSEYILGIQGLRQTNTNVHERETILLPDALTANYSAFGLIQHRFLKKITIQAGLRYDYKTISTDPVGIPDSADFRAALNRDYNSLSGSLGASWNVNDNLLFRVNGAKAFRTPNLAELTSNGPHETRYEVGNSQLRPENSLELDFSMHYHTKNFIVDLAGFYNSIDHYIFISPTSDTSASGLGIYRYLQSNSSLYGGETELHFHPALAEWLHLETNFSLVIGKRSDGANLPFIPAPRIRGEIRAEKGRLLYLRKPFVAVKTTSVFRQNHPAPDESPTAGYTLADLVVGGNIRIQHQQLFFSISLNNIFDTKYTDHLSTLKEVNLLDPGRNIALSLHIPFEVTKKAEP